ncbi:hypothetical protein FocTR4_00014797 [Fusarium oxysporum f. sp. cubense]|uniref:FAD linked oxidase N-terminal domain-containing protein n=1 Tax=Fusarium oxysporum f. sp. cubense TaxID=61366 RepID=A0A5C6SXC9_FUSOC|nr:hypothetical protein FocTR4_00014797 [Fusarium oxysporum f. sp. cubense]
MATVNPLVLLPGVAPSLDKQDYRDPSKMHRMFDITSKQHFVSTAVITPRNVAEAQAIVKLYNKFEIPLWPFSTGRNVGYISHGTLVCTGMGALPNPYADLNAPLHEQEPNSAWQLFNYGFGPYNDGIFMQSSLSIVIKMGIWLMVNPGGY